MNHSFVITEPLRNLLHLALKEDTGTGDITTLATVPTDKPCFARLFAKAAGVIAGQPVFEEIFRLLDPEIRFQWFIREGDPVPSKTLCLEMKGNARAVLIGERTALNLLQRMSGIASLTSRYVKKISHTKAKIIDTRKTTPLWRILEKYAVTAGGGSNHRMGLYDMFLIKDNHIVSAGGISAAIQAALEYRINMNLTAAIEVETKNIGEVQEALMFPIDRIMLDNMSADEIREAVHFVAGRCETEASGGVTVDTVCAIAETGVDFISAGALTHSAPALDLSLLIETETRA